MKIKQKEDMILIIEKAKSRNIVIVVEGKKDKAALKKLGLTNIIELSKKPIYEIVEKIAYSERECIILTDLDEKGKELYGRLTGDLQRFGVRIDNELREFLFRNTKIRQIEGLSNLT